MEEKIKIRYLIAAELRSLHGRGNFTLEEISNGSNVNKDTISRYENGTVSQQVDILEKILDFYQVSFPIFFKNIYANKQKQKEKEE